MSFSFQAEVRKDLGKGASRRLRRAEQVPAILYGAGQEAVSLVLDHNKVIVAQASEAFYAEPVTLVVDGKEVQAKVVAVQRHPVKPKVVHLDFIRA